MDNLTIARPKLSTSEDRFQNFFELIPDPACIVSFEGVLQEINIAFFKTLGYSKEELLGRPFLDFIHPDDLEKTRHVIDEKFKQGTTASLFSNRYVNKNGTIIWLEWYSQAQADNKTIFAVARNVTDRHQTEVALQESEIRYRSLFEHLLDGFAYCQMLYDDQGRPEDFIYLSVNEAFSRLTGLKEVVGKRVTEVIPRIKELQPELLETYGRVASTAVSEKFEIDFKPLGLYLAISVYSPAKGYFVAVFENITERKRVAETLSKSEARFRIVQEISPDGFTILHPLRDAEGTITDFTWIYENNAIAQINGTNPQQVIGKRLLDLFPSHRGTLIFDAYLHVANTGEARVLDEIPVGEIISKRIWLRLVIVSMGEDIAILAQNITEHKKAKEEIISHAKELENMNRLMVGREIKMAELKEKIIELEDRIKKLPISN